MAICTFFSCSHSQELSIATWARSHKHDLDDDHDQQHRSPVTIAATPTPIISASNANYANLTQVQTAA
jgi:hypothetical protein